MPMIDVLLVDRRWRAAPGAKEMADPIAMVRSNRSDAHRLLAGRRPRVPGLRSVGLVASDSAQQRAALRVATST